MEGEIVVSGGNVIFSSKELRSAAEIGSFLVSIGEKLQADGSFTLTQGAEEFQIAPSGNTNLEIKYKTKGEKHEFEIEIEWKPGQQDVAIK